MFGDHDGRIRACEDKIEKLQQQVIDLQALLTQAEQSLAQLRGNN
jgi:phage shock protein A